MYLDTIIKIPDAKGKITRKKKGDSIYINYEYGRIYDPDRKYNIPQRVTIGKESKSDPSMMQPNQNFLMYFPDQELPETREQSKRSSCLRVGAYIVLRKIIEEYGLQEILGHYFSPKDRDLFLDLMVYSMITENNAAQYYPDYGYNHPLFSKGMRIYSDSRVSAFLKEVTIDQRVGFLNEWNETRDHREKIYISYDSTNKNCQAGDIRMVEYGHAKEDKGLPVINYSIAYDTKNREPLFYEEYAGSIVDISQLKYMLGKAQGYGYKKVGFILDRGYFSKDNIEHMDKLGYDFVIMVKGMAPLVNKLVLENKGTFENDRDCSIRKYGVYGTTVRSRMYYSDEKERYFHIYFNDSKKAAEHEQIEVKIEKLEQYLRSREGKVYEPSEKIKEYFEPFIDEKSGVFLFAREKKEVIEREIDLCGYFVIVTSQKMTAKDALELYKSRDCSEKLFRGDKSYLGNRSMRVYTDESVSAKIFIEFAALIVRSRFYCMLKDENEKLESRQNYMDVPAAIRELEKIEMIRGIDNIYRLDHAVTAVQKTILGAFGITQNGIKEQIKALSERLNTTEGRQGV
ncbi:MAG: transposase [Firmicutes bacterium]|nr:transposase [Bacillota bacterium]